MESDPIKIGIALTSFAGGLILGKRWLNGPLCSLTRDLSSKIVIITGASSGIGKETARSLAKMNAKVILACRDPAKASNVVKTLREESKNMDIEFMQLDLADLKSIKDFSRQFQLKHKRLDVLINNAGVINFHTKYLTKDGFENQFGVNYLGHFYLTNKLLETMKKTPESRIVNVACSAYSSGKINWEDIMSIKEYRPYNAFAQSKLAMVLFTRALNKKLEKSNIKAVSVHPGVVRTDLFRDMPKAWYLDILLFIQAPFWHYLTKNPWRGAQSVLYCSLEDYEKLEGGQLYAKNKKKEMAKNALNDEDMERLWKKSVELLISKKMMI